jgi:hypothetical protein
MDDATRLDLLLALHLLASGGMLGVTWIVQLVTYPRFVDVAPERWSSFHALHGARITLVVFPLMLVELGTAVMLVLSPPAPVDEMLAWVRLVLAAGAWLLTALVSVPIHRALARAGDPALVRRLVRTHALRTSVWTAGALVAAALLVAAP